MIRLRTVADTAARVADAALEVTVAGSFGSPGIRVRQRMFDWEDLPRLDGRTVLITGATSGIGRAAAVAMARLGAAVTIVGRDEGRTVTAAEQITADASSELPVRAVVADLSRLADARGLVDQITAGHDHLDVLVHNAGALSATHELTADGFETTYAAQVLGPHVITTGLLALLQAGTQPEGHHRVLRRHVRRRTEPPHPELHTAPLLGSLMRAVPFAAVVRPLADSTLRRHRPFPAELPLSVLGH